MNWPPKTKTELKHTRLSFQLQESFLHIDVKYQDVPNYNSLSLRQLIFHNMDVIINSSNYLALKYSSLRNLATCSVWFLKYM